MPQRVKNTCSCSYIQIAFINSILTKIVSNKKIKHPSVLNGEITHLHQQQAGSKTNLLIVDGKKQNPSITKTRSF